MSESFIGHLFNRFPIKDFGDDKKRGNFILKPLHRSEGSIILKSDWFFDSTDTLGK